MATRTQAKAAVDAAAVLAKADIDLLPSTTNIVWGTIRFAPSGRTIYLQVLDLAEGVALKDAIVAALASASRPAVTSFLIQQPIRETSVWPPASTAVRTIAVTSGDTKYVITIP